ncbi:ABC transporter ATP-binding protein [Neobacillus vireti]|uniref:ABC transporter n=1 Tax=Neobacillus vireti LMG 21834 TaxID=1131730 RepID=A0AB94IMA2_9BACI|nr:ABC transporter ATP-binding protein [Neobacillus vireti]ETI68063.1 ABC transporter [Neobacillus vireti LMG 21834]KLT18199.1 sugar ABC transporter ATP-binding protein [Neobacillus vireti]
MKIQLRDITMRFDNVTAVDRLNVTIEEGTLVSLLGPSGCGKSTTLFMLAGLYQPTEGELYFGDRLVNKVEPENREIGMVFQNYALYPHLTVLKNIMFPLKMAKVPKKEAEERAREMAALVQIDHLLDRKPSQLSGGQQQRVAIARALVKKPKLLLLDEPLSNLDARLRLEMREEIRRIQQEVGITTIFVTHDQEEAMSISDKVLLMKDGKGQQFSPPQDMYDYPENQFVAQFLGNPPINLLSVKLRNDLQTIVLPDTEDTYQLDSLVKSYVDSNSKLELGVRPEDFYIEFDLAKAGITVEVMMVERIGRDNLLYARLGQTNLRAIVSPDVMVNRGDMVKLAIRPGRTHLFDRSNGKNLLH